MMKVDFIVPVVIQGIRIQGWQEGNTRMLAKEFVVKYGNDISKLTTYQDPSEIVKVLHTTENFVKINVSQIESMVTLQAHFVMFYYCLYLACSMLWMYCPCCSEV